VTGSARYSFVQQLLLRLRVVFVSGVASVALVACGQTPTINPEASPPQSYGPPVSLAINGFNYTDLPVDYFSIGSAGGGNIFVSSPTSGGGKTSCCFTWHPISRLPMPVKVEWMRNIEGKRRWCEKTVQLKGPIPDKPTAFGVHFMQDGDIQVEITQGEADPKLRLARFDAGKRKESGNVIHDEETARCRDGR
jgi:Protein of unknown function (DUF3304)